MEADPVAMATHFGNVDVFFNCEGSGCWDKAAMKRKGAASPQDEKNAICTKWVGVCS